jgi:hypothetical protein
MKAGQMTKIEIRNSKQIQMSKSELGYFGPVEYSNFEIRICFEFRDSDFEFSH